MQKAQGDIQQVVSANGTNIDDEANGDAGQVIIHEDGTVRSVLDDNASTRAIASTDTPRILSSTEVNGSPLEGDNVIPTIKISTDSDVDEEVAAAKAEGPVTDENVKQNGIKETTLEKPVQAAAGEEDRSAGDASALPAQEPFSFSNKRLCERWLDNLFMVLYEVRGSLHRLTCLLIPVIGLESLDYFQSRSGSFQNATCCISENRVGMGDIG